MTLAVEERIDTASTRTWREPSGALLAVPGVAVLVLAFVLPIVLLIVTSLMSPVPDSERGFFQPDTNVGNYGTSIATYWPEYLRSIWFAGLATLVNLVIALPIAYVIAIRIRSQTVKQLLLVLVISPFLVGYVLRILAWRQILADEGWLVTGLQAVGILGESDRLSATAFAAVAGLTYTFLPFMILPIYAVLEQLDVRLLDAAADTYAAAWTRFRLITLPLAVPGILAGTLLCFIPAMGDFVNAAVLGNRQNTMVGSVIEARFFAVLDYPTAAALSALLMVLTTALVVLYLRRFGSGALVRS